MTIRKQTERCPPSHNSLLCRAGFTVVRFLNRSVRVQSPDETARYEWLPDICIAPGSRPCAYKVIEWMPEGHPANGYGFDGWHVSCDGSSGGMYRTIGEALAWFVWRDSQVTI
jgi:hypothetical protein